MTNLIFSSENRKFQRATIASSLIFFAALPVAAKTPKTNVSTVQPSTTIASDDATTVSSAVSSPASRKAAPTKTASRQVSVPRRLNAPDLASRIGTARAINTKKTSVSSTRLALVASRDSVTPRTVSAPAVSDDLVQNYLALTKPAKNVVAEKTRGTAVEKPAMTQVTTPKTVVAQAPGAVKNGSQTKNATEAKNAPEVKGAPEAKSVQPKSSTRLAMIAPSPVAAQTTTTIATTTVTAPRRTPANLSSRHKDRLLLAQLEADLARADRGLDRANVTLTRGQKQLMSVGATLRTAMLDAGTDAKGLNPFVRVAMRYAGTPYVWGGESRNGFDCSGFIIVVMRDLGMRALPHSAAEQFNYGMPVAQSLLKPGDIVFFKNTYKPGISHVGIYLGRRRYIEAAGTGKGTVVSSLDSAHAREHYAGARRLIRG